MDDAASSRRQAIQAIYKDTSLTGQEKHKKVQEIMKLPLDSFVKKKEKVEEEKEEGKFEMAIGEICGNSSLSDEERNKEFQIALDKDDSRNNEEKKDVILALLGEIPMSMGLDGVSHNKQAAKILAKTEDVAISRRRAIAAIFCDKTLSMAQRQKRIKKIIYEKNEEFLARDDKVLSMEKGDDWSKEKVMLKSVPQPQQEKFVSEKSEANYSNEKASNSKMESQPEDPASAKRKAIAAVYRDTTLTPAEKHARVQSLMKGGQVETFQREEDVMQPLSRSNPRLRQRPSTGMTQSSVTGIPTRQLNNASDPVEDEKEEDSDSDTARSYSEDNTRDSRSYLSRHGESTFDDGNSHYDDSTSDSDTARSYSEDNTRDSRSYLSHQAESTFDDGNSHYDDSTRDSRSYLSSYDKRRIRSQSDESSRTYSGQSNSDLEEGEPRSSTPTVRDTNDEDTLKGTVSRKSSCCRRCCSYFLFFMIMLGAIGGPFLYKYWDEVEAEIGIDV